MEYTILVLLFYCCLQVFADAVDGTQTLDCDATVQKQHRLLLQYSQSHLTTVRSAIKNINDSLQGLTQGEQDVKVEADKSRELATLLQDVLSKMKNNGADGADENRIFDEKLEKEITDLKSRLLQLDFKLSALKIEDQTNKLQLKQMQTQEKDLEISISQQNQIGPLENIEIYLVAQMERCHETLELERQCCQFKLDATTKLMESNSKLVESELKQVESKNFQIWNNKVAENSIAIKNISEQINICIKQKTNLASENMKQRCQSQTAGVQLTRLGTGIYSFQTTQKVNWYAARDWCKARGMDLVTIDSAAEDQLIVNYLYNYYVTNRIPKDSTSFFWIGLNDLAVDRSFNWVATGQPLGGYTNWSPGQPAGKYEHCVEYMYRDAPRPAWNDRSCTAWTGPFICKVNAPCTSYVGV